MQVSGQPIGQAWTKRSLVLLALVWATAACGNASSGATDVAAASTDAGTATDAAATTDTAAADTLGAVDAAAGKDVVTATDAGVDANADSSATTDANGAVDGTGATDSVSSIDAAAPVDVKADVGAGPADVASVDAVADAGSDAGPDAGAANPCEDLTKAITAELEVVSTCAADVDCTVLQTALCPFAGMPCGGAAVNKSQKLDKLQALLTSAALPCNVAMCKCMPPPAAVCQKGHCAVP